MNIFYVPFTFYYFQQVLLILRAFLLLSLSNDVSVDIVDDEDSFQFSPEAKFTSNSYVHVTLATNTGTETLNNCYSFNSFSKFSFLISLFKRFAPSREKLPLSFCRYQHGSTVLFLFCFIYSERYHLLYFIFFSCFFYKIVKPKVITPFTKLLKGYFCGKVKHELQVTSYEFKSTS